MIFRNLLDKTNRSRKLPAYSMIEISISLLVISIMSLSMFQMISTLQQSYKMQLTKQRQQIILKALGDYIYRHQFLPYPCKPSEQHIGISQAMTLDDKQFTLAHLSSIECDGTLPWRTLGISQETAYDGNGNAFTYIMNPALGFFPKTTYIHPHGNNHHILDLSKFIATHKILTNNLHYTDANTVKHPDVLYAHHHDDLILQHAYDNFISIHYQYTNSQGETHNHAIYDKSGEHTFFLPITVNNNCKTADCIAVVIISHGTTGGHFDKEGKRTDVKDIYEARQNTLQNHPYLDKGPKCQIYTHSTNPEFNHVITYVTRFGFHIYGGPVLNNHYLVSIHGMQAHLNDDANIHESPTYRKAKPDETLDTEV